MFWSSREASRRDRQLLGTSSRCSQNHWDEEGARRFAAHGAQPLPEILQERVDRVPGLGEQLDRIPTGGGADGFGLILGPGPKSVGDLKLLSGRFDRSGNGRDEVVGLSADDRPSLVEAAPQVEIGVARAAVLAPSLRLERSGAVVIEESTLVGHLVHEGTVLPLVVVGHDDALHT